MSWDFSIFEFASIYVFLSILLLLMIIYSRAPYWLKAIPIVISIFFLIGSYNTIDGLLGRPAKLDLPSEFVYVYHVTEAPNPANDFPGRIIILLKDKFGFRLHEIPYAKPARKKLQQAKQGSNGGRRKMKIKTQDKKKRKGKSYSEYSQPSTWKILNNIVNPPKK